MVSVHEIEGMLVSPVNVGTPFHHDASDKELELLGALGDHFGGQDYALLSSESATETAPLSEREMMFLVSSKPFPFLLFSAPTDGLRG